MTKKQEKKQWLLKKLAESTVALTVGAVFILSPGQSQASTPSQIEKKQTVIDRLINIKNNLLKEYDTKDENDDHVQKKQLFAQYWRNGPRRNNWPNFWNNWNNWPNWNNFWRNWR